MPPETLDASKVDADIELLGAALDAATSELSGVATLAQVRALREAAIELRRPDAAKDARERFAASIARLDDEALAEVARAVTHWFHLVNAAEEVQRVRLLRRYDRAHPAKHSLADALSRLVEAGLDASQVHAQIELLRRLAQRERDGERLLGALFTTTNGIAAGLQTAG